MGTAFQRMVWAAQERRAPASVSSLVEAVAHPHHGVLLLLADNAPGLAASLVLPAAAAA
ncbi:MAG TPA: hypothetical protein VEH07_05765 [Alphaproteobacteria bacterium]|nr:hypothetical protein [Alphaproteobacteria bacterium]